MGRHLVACPHTGVVAVVVRLACGHRWVTEWPVCHKPGRYFDATHAWCSHGECGVQLITRIHIVLT